MTFYDWVKLTPFGTWTGDCMYVIDVFLGSALAFAWKRWMRNPFNKTQKEKSKAEMVKEYMEKKNAT